jgi:hypothetical protein
MAKVGIEEGHKGAEPLDPKLFGIYSCGEITIALSRGYWSEKGTITELDLAVSVDNAKSLVYSGIKGS